MTPQPSSLKQLSPISNINALIDFKSFNIKTTVFDMGDETKKPEKDLSFLKVELENCDFLPAEITLETAAFFSASTTKLKRVIKEKRFKTILATGETIETKLQIIPSVAAGLPITSDLDFYRSFMRVLHEYRQDGGSLSAPIKVSSERLIRYAGKSKSQKEWLMVQTFLDRMANTAIKGEVYNSKTKTFKKLNTSPFAEVRQFGQVLPDGSVADSNYIWLAPFYIENMTQGNLRALDHNFHLKLKKSIAKTIFPLIETGWYASGGTRWSKRYSNLCHELLLTEYTSLSRIKQQFGPSLEELKEHKFLDHYTLEKSKSSNDFILSFYPGSYYQAVQDHLGERRQKAKHIADATSQTVFGEAQAFLLERILEVCGDKHSERYYRKLIIEEPDHLLEMALSETKDMKLRDKIKTTPGQMFVAILKDIKDKRAN